MNPIKLHYAKYKLDPRSNPYGDIYIEGDYSEGDIAVVSDYSRFMSVVFFLRLTRGWTCLSNEFYDSSTDEFLGIPRQHFDYVSAIKLPDGSVGKGITTAEKSALGLNATLLLEAGIDKINMWRAMNVPKDIPVAELEFLGFGADSRALGQRTTYNVGSLMQLFMLHTRPTRDSKDMRWQ